MTRPAHQLTRQILIGLVTAIVLYAVSQIAKAWDGKPMDLGCSLGTGCEVHLGAGYWIIRFPDGQTVRKTEINNERNVVIESMPVKVPAEK